MSKWVKVKCRDMYINIREVERMWFESEDVYIKTHRGSLTECIPIESDGDFPVIYRNSDLFNDL